VGIWIAVVASGVVALWLLLAYGSANVGRIATGFTGAHADFATFHRSAVALLDGRSIYDTGAGLVNLNPPFWTVLFAPMGGLDVAVAYRIFSILTALLVVGAGLLVARALRVQWWVQILVSVAILLSSPLMGTVALGQVYGILVAGLAGAWLAGRRGHHIAAGICLGLVIAIKPTLAPLLLLPIAQRRWPALNAAVASIAGATLLGMVFAGPDATWRWLSVLRAEQLSTFGDNASLPSFVARLGGPAWTGFLLGGVLMAITYRRVRDNSDAALWAFTAATLLLSPVAWHNYLVLCFPGVFVLLRARHYAISVLMLTLPLIGVEWGMHLWKGNSVVDHIGASLYCFVLLTYWFALLPSAVQHNRDDPGEVREPGNLCGAEHRTARTADQ
jgi:alpha-1,2-mannosyltransferase/arabinofuranan 3-O-arabinosyltransferase